MGRFATLIQFIRKAAGVSDVQCDPGGGANVTAYNTQGAGDDSHPLPDDQVILVEVPRSNNYAVAGYIDPRNAQTATAGERRIYSRNTDGQQVAEVFLHDDGQIRAANDVGLVDIAANGTIQIRNANGSATIAQTGVITLNDGAGGTLVMSAGTITITGTAINLVGATNINGFTIGTDGQATDANGISLHGHSHTQGPDSAGDDQVRTDAASMP